jgi:hypothetical protein
MKDKRVSDCGRPRLNGMIRLSQTALSSSQGVSHASQRLK